jgi:hypothetical protein
MEDKIEEDELKHDFGPKAWQHGEFTDQRS